MRVRACAWMTALVLAGSVHADGPGESWLGITLDETTQGALLFPAESPGRYLPAPLLETRARLEVTGVVARVAVTQSFQNHTEGWQEGLYAFPLPDQAAVDTLRVRIGERLIEGEIQEKQAARARYQAAKDAGKKAALVEQRRPDLFATAVANIGPGERVEVTLEYQQALRVENGELRLHFPLKVLPRYTPGGGAGDPNLAGGQPQRARIQVELEAGFPLESVSSPSHTLDMTEASPSRRSMTLKGESVPGDRDFVLEWRALAGSDPQAVLLQETTPEGVYALVMVQPPRGDIAATVRIPRETLFLVDTSGSMKADGAMDQAKAALHVGIGRLDPGDTFEVIEFDSDAVSLFGSPEAATPEARRRALAFVDQLVADGGTNILAAVQRALASPPARGRVRQLLFVTDGAVSNESEVLRTLRAGLDDRRLFAVGIGAAPNAHFMRQAALAGRGTFTRIGKVEEVEHRMADLFRKLENPVLSNLEVHFPAAAVDACPARVPDLYLGEPLVVAARLTAPAGPITVSGKGSARAFSWTLTPVASERPGIGRLWAREKLTALVDGRDPERVPPAVRKQALEVALAHHLVSPYTSLVAVERTPSRPAEAPLTARRLDRPEAPPPPPGGGAAHVPEPESMLLVLLALLAAGYQAATSPRADPG